MSNTLNHLKKGESLSNRQLCIIDSALKSSTESSSSFSNTLYQAVERVTKIEVVGVNITSGSIYNVNNDNATMLIDTSLINGEVESEKLVIDDTEISNNQIVDTNIPSGNINKYNVISSNNIQITDISILDTFTYNVGLFGNQLVSFYNTDNVSPINTLLESTDPTAIFCSKYNFDQTFKWRFKITGTGLVYAKIEVVSSGIYIMGRVSSSSTIKFYNSNDTYTAQDLIMSLNGSFICEYDFDGNFVWRLKIEQNITTTNNIFMKVNESNSKIYVSVQYKAGLLGVFYDKNDSVSFASSPGYGNDMMALGSYSTDGLISGASDFYYYLTSINSGYVIPTSLTFLGNRLFVAFAFDEDATFIPSTISALQSNGDVNIGVAQFDISAPMIPTGVIQIGGTSTDQNAHVDVYDNNGTQNIYITGYFTSNPVVFYKSDGTQDTILQNPIVSSVNIFVAQFPINYIESVQSLNYKFYITSTKDIDAGCVKVNSSGVYITGNFKIDAKFHDINGYSSGNDITGVTNVDGLFSQFISRYGLDGNFIDRFYNNSSGTVLALDTTSKFVFSINNFTSAEVSNIYTNTSGTIDKILPPKDINNAIFLSYFRVNRGFIINYDILDNTVIFRTLQNDEIGFFLNVNTFTETLGFSQSQKFIASNFGSAITWKEITVANGVNSSITFNFSIANLTTERFDIFTETIYLDIFTQYTPYSLAFELNKAFNAKKTSVSYLTHTFNPFVYDAIKNIFYCRMDIQGTFVVVDTALSNALGINLQLTTYVSQFSVISNIITGDVDDQIVDNTKLTLKLTDNIISAVVNNESFNATFPNVSSNTLTMGATLNTNISAMTGVTTDVLTNITTGTEISFNYGYQPKYTGFSGSPFDKVAMSSNGVFQTVVIELGNIWTSSDTGVTWTSMDSVRMWNSVAMSSDGQYQTALVRGGSIYVSVDFGSTWLPKDSVRSWNTVAMSSDGIYQTATVFNGFIYTSSDRGITWNKRAYSLYWTGVAMSSDGRYQSAVVNGGSIWISDDFGVSWDESASGTQSWQFIAMSSNGTRQTAVGADIWHSADSGNTWFAATGSVGFVKTVAMSSTGQFQTAGASGTDILISVDFGVNWTPVVIGVNSSWFSVAMSSDGLLQTLVAFNQSMWKSSDTGATWTQVTTAGDGFNWSGLAFSSTGQLQSAVAFNGDIWRSTDYGQSWVVDATVGVAQKWIKIAMSSDGVNRSAVVNNGYIWTSDDSGSTWVADASAAPEKFWTSVAMSADGTIRTATVDGQDLWNFNNGTGDWVKNLTTGATKRWRDIAISSDGTKQTAVVTQGNIWISSDSGATWVEIVVGGSKLWRGIAMSSDGVRQTANAELGHIWTSSDSGASWTPDTSVGATKSWYSVSMASDGRYQLATYRGGIYESSDYGATWIINTTTSTANWSSGAMSSDGLIRGITLERGSIFVNLFSLGKLTFNVGALINNLVSPDQIVFEEIATTANNYALLDGFNMSSGFNFTVKSITTSPVQDLFITPGNYSIAEFVAQINSQIAALNTGFTQPAFEYSTTSNKITFNPHYTGAESDILVITNLLTSMGFTELPSFILSPVMGNSIVNQNLSGSNNIYILSEKIGNVMKEFTMAVNEKFKNVIASLKFIDGEYKIESKEEIFLSQKTTITSIDIIVMNDKSELVNLNGGNISMRLYFTKS